MCCCPGFDLPVRESRNLNRKRESQRCFISDDENLSSSSELDDQITTSSDPQEVKISKNNWGYKALVKMGWDGLSGLGVRKHGRIDPVRIEIKADYLGIGKGTELNFKHKISTSRRKALETEVRISETEEQRKRREENVSKKECTTREVKKMISAFLCETCNKQYSNISEYETHLSSYDHHHRKRLKELSEFSRKVTIGASSARRGKLDTGTIFDEKETIKLLEARKNDITLTQALDKPVKNKWQSAFASVATESPNAPASQLHNNQPTNKPFGFKVVLSSTPRSRTSAIHKPNEP